MNNNNAQWMITLPEGTTPQMCVGCLPSRPERACGLPYCALTLTLRNSMQVIHPVPNGGKVEGKTQTDRLKKVLGDFKPHSTFELVRKVYGINTATVARLASRVDDLRHAGWHIVAQRSKKRPNKWWYMVTSHPGLGWYEPNADEKMTAADAATGEWE